MEKWFSTSLDSLAAIGLTAAGIYVTLIIFTRVAGKRSFSKMSSFDFAMTVAIGSIIATTVLTRSISLLQGIAGLAAIYLLQMAAAVLRRFSFFRNAVDNAPLLLMDGPNILEENLKKGNVTKGDLLSKLRESNVLRLDQVKAVVFETTGDISVLHGENSDAPEAWLMADVNR
ncbi:MAG: YetF domain-containing protein [Salinimicrobium sp.]